MGLGWPSQAAVRFRHCHPADCPLMHRDVAERPPAIFGLEVLDFFLSMHRRAQQQVHRRSLAPVESSEFRTVLCAM